MSQQTDHGEGILGGWGKGKTGAHQGTGMGPLSHLTASAVVAAGIAAATHSAPAAAAMLAAGVLMDLDHIPEYLREYGVRVDPKHFFSMFRASRFQRLYLVLHSWELIAAIALAAWLTHWNSWLAGTLAGAGLHLTMDQCRNRVRPLGYFFWWRWKNGFAAGSVLTRKDAKDFRAGIRNRQ